MDLERFGLVFGAVAALGLGACEAGSGDEAVADLEKEIEACLDRGRHGGWSDPSGAMDCLDAIPRYPVDPSEIAEICVAGYTDCVSRTWSEELCTPILDACFSCADGDDHHDVDHHDGYHDEGWDCDHEHDCDRDCDHEHDCNRDCDDGHECDRDCDHEHECDRDCDRDHDDCDRDHDDCDDHDRCCDR